MNIRSPETNSAVNLFRAHLGAAGFEVPLNVAQEGYAKSKGFDNWQALVAFEKSPRVAGTNLFDYTPQLSKSGQGPEKSLRAVLLEYYSHYGISIGTSEKIVAQYIESVNASLASEVPGKVSPVVPTIREVLKRVSDMARGYDLGTPDGHALADLIDEYSRTVSVSGPVALT